MEALFEDEVDVPAPTALPIALEVSSVSCPLVWLCSSGPMRLLGHSDDVAQDTRHNVTDRACRFPGIKGELLDANMTKAERCHIGLARYLA